MNSDDLSRVKSDLETIENAMGLAPAWGPGELRVTVLFAAAGLVAAAWAVFVQRYPPLLGLLAFVFPVIAWLRLATAPPGESLFASRDVRQAIRTLWLVPPIVALFFWCRHAGLRPLDFLGLSTFLVGTMLVSSVAGERRQPALWGWAAALVAAGLLLPVVPVPPAAVLGAAICLGALGSAAAAWFDRGRTARNAAH